MEKKTYQYEHMICDQPDEEIFRRQCVALERNIPGLVKGEFIQTFDLDRQEYTLNGANVVVENDLYLDGVFIRSDANLLPYFQKQQVA